MNYWYINTIRSIEVLSDTLYQRERERESMSMWQIEMGNPILYLLCQLVFVSLLKEGLFQTNSRYSCLILELYHVCILCPLKSKTIKLGQPMPLLRKVCYGPKVGHHGLILEFFGWTYLKSIYWYHNLHTARPWSFRLGLLIDLW